MYANNALGSALPWHRECHPMDSAFFNSLTPGEAIDSRYNPDHPNAVALNISRSDPKSHVISESHDVLPGQINALVLYRRKYNNWLVKIQPPPSSAFRILVINNANKTSFSEDFDGALEWIRAYDFGNLTRWWSTNDPGPGVPFVNINGADPRLIEMEDGTVWVSFGTQGKNSPLRYVYGELHITPNSDHIQVCYICYHIFITQSSF